MKEKRSTFRDWLHPAFGISGVGLFSALCWMAASAAIADPTRCLLIALAPLVVASYRHLWVGRALGWSGLAAQAALLLLNL
jgi:hypothetical protein